MKRVNCGGVEKLLQASLDTDKGFTSFCVSAAGFYIQMKFENYTVDFTSKISVMYSTERQSDAIYI